MWKLLQSLLWCIYHFSVCSASGTKVCVGTLKRISCTPATFDSQCTKELLSRYPRSVTFPAPVCAFYFSNLRKFSCLCNMVPSISKTVHNLILSNSTTFQRIGHFPEISIKTRKFCKLTSSQRECMCMRVYTCMHTHPTLNIKDMNGLLFFLNFILV